MQNKIIIKTRLIHWPWHFLYYYFTFCDSALENQMWTALSFHAFMVILLQIYSLSLMLWTDIKESLMIKPSAPVSSALASVHYVHTTLFEYQAPTQHCKHSPFFLYFNYLPTRFNSNLHGSASTNKLTSGPVTLGLIPTNWDMCFVLELHITFTHSAGASSRWCFLLDCYWHCSNLKKVLRLLFKYPVSYLVLALPSKHQPLASFDLIIQLLWVRGARFPENVLTVQYLNLLLVLLITWLSCSATLVCSTEKAQTTNGALKKKRWQAIRSRSVVGERETSQQALRELHWGRVLQHMIPA